jgi:GTPase SAR1 family protein
MSCCTSDDEPIKRKLVIVGDGACGKTSLLSRFSRGKFPIVSFLLFIYFMQNNKENHFF